MYINAVLRKIRFETHCWTTNQKGSSVLPDLLRVNQWLFYKWDQENNTNIIPTKCFVVFFLLCGNGTPSYSAIVAWYFMSAAFISHDICLKSVTIPIWGPVHRVQSNHIRQVRWSVWSGLGILFQNLVLLHFDHMKSYIILKSLSIYLYRQLICMLVFIKLG